MAAYFVGVRGGSRSKTERRYNWAESPLAVSNIHAELGPNEPESRQIVRCARLELKSLAQRGNSLSLSSLP